MSVATLPQMYRTLEPGVSLLSTAEVCVAVHPVGPMPKEVLDGYMDAISRFKHVSLSASRSFYRDSGMATPFSFLDWSTGYMHFRFQPAELCRRQSRLVDLHWNRQVIAVIGLMYCPLSPSVQKAYDEFCKACKLLYPGCLVQRCFVVEPSEEQLVQGGGAHMRDLVMFPPGGLAHFCQHLEVWMHDLAALIITELEKWILEATPLSAGPEAGSTGRQANSSYADSREFTGSSAMMEEVTNVTKRLTLIEDDETREKKRWARLLKAKADACCLAGSPLDAFEHYKSCAETSKAVGDLVWYGAAMEGMASAHLLMAMCGIAPPATSLPALAPPPAPPAPDLPPTGGSVPPPVSATPGSTATVGSAGSASLPSTVEVGGGTLSPGPSTGPEESSSSQLLLAGPTRSVGTPGPEADAPTHSRAQARKSTATGFHPRTLWDSLKRSGVEGDVRDMVSHARTAYRRRGGCPVLMVETNLKLIRLTVGLRGVHAARKEALELAGACLDLLPALPHADDRLTALTEVAQVLGCLGYIRRRTLLLWQAIELGRSLPPPQVLLSPPPGSGQGHGAGVGAAVERGEITRLVATTLEPPVDLLEPWAPADPGTLATSLSAADGGGLQGSGGSMARVGSGKPGLGDAPGPVLPVSHPHFAQRAAECATPVPRALAWLPVAMMGRSAGKAGTTRWAEGVLPVCGLWETVRLGLLEAALWAARQAGAGVDAWEVAAALLRDHHVGMTSATQANLLEVMSSAAAASPPHARRRPRLGLPLIAQLRRVLPHRPPLQPAQLALTPAGRLTTPGQAGVGMARFTGGPGGTGGASSSPFIFSAAASRAKAGGNGGKNGDAAAPSPPDWVCGEEACVEVYLTNPLAVPLRLEQVHVVFTYRPAAGQGADGKGRASDGRHVSTSQLSLDGGGGRAAAWLGGAAGGEEGAEVWQPAFASVMLAPRGRPTRLLLSGRALRTGLYTLAGIRATVAGMSWVQPLLPPGPLPRSLQALGPVGVPRPPPPRNSRWVEGATRRAPSPRCSA